MNNNNQNNNINNTTARAFQVRYSMTIVLVCASVFFFSQVLDNIFYDYTVIETEIIFIKSVDNNSDVQIELNEITESSNSLVEALKSNIKTQTPPWFLAKRQPNDDILLQRTSNSQFKETISRWSKTELMKQDHEQFDSIFVASVLNKITNGPQLSGTFSLYYDQGQNFFDLSQAITLNTQWFLVCEKSYQGSLITAWTSWKETALLHLTSSNGSYFEIFDLSNPSESQIIEIKSQSQLVSISDTQLAYSYPYDIYLFHVAEKINSTWVPGNSVYISVSEEDIYTHTVGLIFLESPCEQPLLFVSHIRMNKQHTYLYGDIYVQENQKWQHFSSVFKKNITDYFQSREIFDVNNLDINYLQDYDQNNKILVLCFFNHILIHFQVRPFMFQHKSVKNLQYNEIELTSREMEGLNFKKIHYSPSEHSLYILAENKQKYKIYSIDLAQAENDKHNYEYKIRMPFFGQEKMIKDFQVKKNQYGQTVLILAFADGDVAGILTLQYGEGVLNKTFILELMDVVLTLAFIGFFKFLKKMITRLTSKIFSICKRRQRIF